MEKRVKSRKGRQNGSSVPYGTLFTGGVRFPTLKRWAIFRAFLILSERFQTIG